MYLDLNPGLQRAMFGNLGKTYTAPLVPLLEPAIARMQDMAFGAFDTSRLLSIDKARLFAGALTPNLREVGPDLSIVRAIEMGRDEGIGLYGVPRAAVARRFLTARDMPARRRILGDARTLILDDCDSALDGATSAGLEFIVVMLRDAIGAARAGHLIAAQAGATAVLDGATRTVLDDKTVRETVTRTGRVENRDEAVLDAFTIRKALALMPVYGAHANYRHWEESVPSVFSRHATAHSVARRQFSMRNAVQAILVTTGFVLWVDDASKGRL